MPSLLELVFRPYARFRAAKLRRQGEQAGEIQKRLLGKLLNQAHATAFARDHGLSPETTYEQFRNAVPVRDYEALRPYVDRVVKGEADVLWPGRPLYLAKTSGTTSGTKYIPLTRECMPYHVQGAQDAFSLYIARTGNSSFLNGKMLFLSGSPELEKNPAGLATGRLSGIAQHYVPSWLQRNRIPKWETNCIEDWETKVDKIAEEAVQVDLRLISGIPPWVQMFFERVTQRTGKKPAEVWPNLKLYIEGGVDYSPYESLLTEAMGRKLDLVEVFPASEGFIAVQAGPFGQGLMLMPKYGIFYEFIQLDTYFTATPKRIPLWEVEVGVPYALIMTTNAGLWAYDIGDTVEFTSTRPYLLKVAGRVKHFLSAFGEHVIEQEVTAALLAATQATGAVVTDFTVAPKVTEPRRHEWFIEFATPPADPIRFQQVLDDTLRQKNMYYEDLRKGDILAPAQVYSLPANAFREYMKSIGKLGGQNKIPRLKNDRQLADPLMQMLTP